MNDYYPGERNKVAEKPPPKHAVLSPKWGLDVHGVILSKKLVEVNVHWIDDHGSQLCWQDGCEFCKRNFKRKWKGYVDIWVPRNDRVQVAEILPGAVQFCPALLGDAFQGQLLSLVRRGKDNSTRVQASLRVVPVGTYPTYPPSIDVSAVVFQFYGYPLKENLDAFERFKKLKAVRP